MKRTTGFSTVGLLLTGAAGMLLAMSASARNFELSGTIVACTPTCESFPFQDTGSEFSGYVTMDDAAIADGTWDGGDISGYSFTVLNPDLPVLVSDPPNPATDNPFTLDATPDGGGIVVANGQDITNPRGTFPSAMSAGTTDGDTITGGFIDFWVTQGLLANNGAIITLNFDSNCVGDGLDEPAPCFEVNIFEGLVFVSGGGIGPSEPTTLSFKGEVEQCTPTCESFDFLDVGSLFSGFLNAAIGAGDFTGGDIGDLAFDILNPAIPLSGPSDPPDPATDNPFTLDRSGDGGGVVVANGQDITNPRGTFPSRTSSVSTDGGIITGGFVDFWLTQGVLANNGAIVTLNFDQDCVNAEPDIPAPCFEVNIFEGVVFVSGGSLAQGFDTDGDGVLDNADNCTADVNPLQEDTDGDGIGNICDGDFNQDCAQNFLDLGQQKAVFFGVDSGAGEDMNSDGAVNFLDLGRLKELFFLDPGPSGIPNDCDS